MPPKMKFGEGEKVLCYHGPLLYEAKCIKPQVKDKQVKYFIHYSGWNKNWDEWVPENRVLKYNDTNIQKQEELQKTHVKTKKTKASKVVPKKEPVDKEEKPVAQQQPKTKAISVPSTSASEPSTSTAGTQRKKRVVAKRKAKVKKETTKKEKIKIDMPDDLKSWLVDDRDLVCRQKKLVHLPASFTVEHILDDYIRYRNEEKEPVNRPAPAENIANGVRQYFNIMLGKQLLYKFERPQYHELLIQNRGKQMTEIYGAPHFLRMFAKVGSVLTQIPLDQKTVKVLAKNFRDFIQYLGVAARGFLNLGDYEVASPEYNRQTL